MTGASGGPLAEIVVLDLSRVLAGPLSATVFVELGAEVIDKCSVTLDLQTPAGGGVRMGMTRPAPPRLSAGFRLKGPEGAELARVVQQGFAFETLGAFHRADDDHVIPTLENFRRPTFDLHERLRNQWDL